MVCLTKNKVVPPSLILCKYLITDLDNILCTGTEERLYFRLGTPFFPLLECKFSQKIIN